MKRKLLHSFREEKFDNRQVFDFEGLKGRYDSSSYAIPGTDPDYTDAIKALKTLFDKYEQGGKVVMKYITKLFCGDFGE